MQNHAQIFLTGGYDRQELQDKKQIRLMAARIAKPATVRVTLIPDWLKDGDIRKQQAAKDLAANLLGRAIEYSPKRDKWIARKRTGARWDVIGYYDTLEQAVNARTESLEGKARLQWLARVAENEAFK